MTFSLTTNSNKNNSLQYLPISFDPINMNTVYSVILERKKLSQLPNIINFCFNATFV